MQPVQLRFVARALGVRLGARPVPLSVAFEITHRCNLACSYCDRHEPRAQEMPRECVLKTLDELFDMGMRTLSLDGGEPLTCSFIDEVVSRMLDLGVRVNMNSNGLLVPRKLSIVRKLSKLKVSLDGPRDVHDSVRGTGAYTRAIRGIVAARGERVPVELTCVVGRHNAHAVDALIELARQLGLRVVFQPERAGLFNEQKAPIGSSEIERAFRRIEAHKRTGCVVANRWSSLRHFRSFPRDTPLPCAAGRINVTLDPYGKLFACGQMPREGAGESVLVAGVRAAFEKLPAVSCAQCWCARVVEENLAWGGRFDRFLPAPEPEREPSVGLGHLEGASRGNG